MFLAAVRCRRFSSGHFCFPAPCAKATIIIVDSSIYLLFFIGSATYVSAEVKPHLIQEQKVCVVPYIAHHGRAAGAGLLLRGFWSGSCTHI